MSKTKDRTSDLIRQIIAESSYEGTISIGEFTNLLGERAFCLAILIFSLPNSLPVPGIPGFSTITGIPITFIAVQMLLGRATIWLPKKIAGKSFSKKGMAGLLAKALPGVIWLERFLIPRWLWVTEKLGEQLLGILFIILSLIIALPIPGGNFLPGISMSLVALGMLERDGLFLTLAIAFSIAGIVFMVKVILLFFHAIISWFTSFF
jgi:hypothetical protein